MRITREAYEASQGKLVRDYVGEGDDFQRSLFYTCCKQLHEFEVLSQEYVVLARVVFTQWLAVGLYYTILLTAGVRGLCPCHVYQVG